MTVTVTVAGPQGSGKSQIATVVQMAVNKFLRGNPSIAADKVVVTEEQTR